MLHLCEQFFQTGLNHENIMLLYCIEVISESTFLSPGIRFLFEAMLVSWPNSVLTGYCDAQWIKETFPHTQS